MKTIHVACCFDDRMAIPASVVAASVAETTTDAHVIFYMLRSPQLSIDIGELKRALDRDTFTLVNCVVEDDFSELCKTKQYTSAMYYRFVLDRHVKSDVVIYLDSDMLVRRSLTELYETDLGGHIFGACKDYALLHHLRDTGIPLEHIGLYRGVTEYCLNVVGLDLSTTDYFNTGVLVIDLAAWEKARVSERCMEFCRSHKELVMADQDAANHVIQGKFARLDPRWNAFSYMYDEFFPRDDRYRPEIFGGYGPILARPRGEWRDILAAWAFDPWIVHFAYKSKPWDYTHRRTDYDEEFWRRAAATPFEPHLRRQFLVSRRWGRLIEGPRSVLEVAQGRRGIFKNLRPRPRQYY